MELSVEQAMQQAVAAQSQSKLEEAEGFYRAILQSLPTHPEANHNLGLIAVSVNKAETALAFFKIALESKPKIGQFWLSYIDTLIKNNQIETAKTVLKQGKNTGLFGNRFDDLDKQLNANNIAPSELQLNNLLEQYNNGQYDEAEKLALLITQQFPEHQFGWKVLAAIYGNTSRQTEAIEASQKAIQLVPDDAETHNNLGNAFIALGRLDEAEVSLRQSITKKPDYHEAYNNLGIMLKELGRLDEAEISLKQAILIKPSFIETHYNLGCVLKELGRLNEAEVNFRQAITLKPNDVEAHNNLGITLKELDRLDEAEVTLRQAIALKFDYAEGHNNLGVTLQKLGRLGDAEVSFRQALAFKSDFSHAHNNLGGVLKELGRLDEAEVSFRQTIAMKYDDTEAHNYLGATLRLMGRLEEAEVSLRQAIKLKPDYAEAHDNLGITLQLIGKLDEAEASFRHSILVNPDNSSAYYNLGMFLLFIEQYENAAECFKLSDFYKSKFYLLRCLYLLDKESLFYAQLDYFIEKDEVHPIIGSLVCRSALRYGVEKRNLFCKKPLNYILKTDLSTQYDFNEVFVKTVRNILNENRVPKKIQGLLSNGYQTHGNIFDIEPEATREIQKIIRTEVDKYKVRFKDCSEGLIKHWPSQYNLYGWFINMKRGGELRPHMHEQGWISGSIYINVPQKSKIDSGNLVVCIEDSPTTENKNHLESIDVVTGNMYLFPASLLHYTIPFDSDEERIVLAFDIVPNGNKFEE
jgi:Flp pilus assembly protein TadD